MQNNTIIDLATGERCRFPFEVPYSFIYDRNAGCPRWEQFIDEVTCGDKALATYLQRMVGYCMTDDTSEQCMFFLVGNGCNGKSVFVDTVATMLGEYAVYTPAKMVLKRNHISEAIHEWGRLKGARLAIARKSDDGSGVWFDDSIIRHMTDGCGSVLLEKPLYSNTMEFDIKFKIMLETNQIPVVKGKIQDIWSRIRLVPFHAKFSEKKRDTQLTKRLRDELPGIFNWAVQGAVDWYAHGLPELQELQE